MYIYQTYLMDILNLIYIFNVYTKYKTKDYLYILQIFYYQFNTNINSFLFNFIRANMLNKI